jgi:hypothetical protein
MTAGTIAIGTSTDDKVVISMAGGDGPTINTMISPASARVYAAMMMALADLLDPPALQESLDV